MPINNGRGNFPRPCQKTGSTRSGKNGANELRTQLPFNGVQFCDIDLMFDLLFNNFNPGHNF